MKSEKINIEWREVKPNHFESEGGLYTITFNEDDKYSWFLKKYTEPGCYECSCKTWWCATFITAKKYANADLRKCLWDLQKEGYCKC